MDKSPQMALDASVYKNNLLFTDHYLQDRIPDSQLWSSVYEDATKRLAALRELRASVDPSNLSESQLEENYIQPVLATILGHHFGVQVNIAYEVGKRGIPDYILTENAAQAAAIDKTIYRAGEIEGALVVADAKAWHVDLDKVVNSHSPHIQIDKYLRYSELPWGIITNGQKWRLYERQGSKFRQYYEIDLEAILNSDDKRPTRAFLYFYLFFRHEAFTTGWLNDVLKGSQAYAEDLRDSLEQQIFSALEDIAGGFLRYRRNQMPAIPDAATLETLYEQSLVFLYRLLFIFYAESRNILPVENDRYMERSLQKRIMDLKFDTTDFSSDDSLLYSAVNDLFFYIDVGQPELGIAAYNGKLFSAMEYPFLADKKVGDKYLVPALEKLATVEKKEKKKRIRRNVDYQNLQVSHLGTIYEKLLEYELAYATEDLVISGKDQTYKKATGKKVDIPAGTVYLRTGNNQRKATGSYYTPDYIVRFIVEKTLEPLLHETTLQYATYDDTQGEGIWTVHDPDKLREAILALNILDPATGSGHFAVDVVVYMAEWLDKLTLLPDVDVSYWMRQVAASCIYAVDINPLAVELAKLSIWLRTLASDKPLGFLNHHIRVGNSLVGTRLAQLDSPSPGKKNNAQQKVNENQLPLFEDADFASNVKTAVDTMSAIEAVRADDVSDVKQQEQMYLELQGRLKPYEQLAHVWTARHFGLNITDEEWRAVYTLTLKQQQTPRVREIIAEAEHIAIQPEMRFFHWDVAFPEVFFDATGKPLENPGFDAVIGNPPYVRQERLKTIKPFLETLYDVYSGTADLFLYFYEMGLRQLRENCRLGYITSGTFYNTNSAKPFRNYVHENASFEWVANFGENQPFKEAEMVYPTIAIMRPTPPKETFKHYFMDGNVRLSQMGEIFEEAQWVDSLSEVTAMAEWRFQSKELINLSRKLILNKPELGDVVNKRIYSGIKTGLNEAFIVDGSTRKALINQHESSHEILVPMVRGEDLRPWYQLSSDQYLILTKRGINIENYPAVKQHLQKYKKGLEKRTDCNNGQCEWYELRPCTYYDEFTSAKIFWAEIAKIPRFSGDKGDLYSNNKVHFLVPPSNSWLALLNSRVIWFAISQIAPPLRLRAGLWQYQATRQFIYRLPVPDLTPQQESDLAEIAEAITALAGERYGLHQRVRQDMIDDLGGGDADINSRVALYNWWEYDPQQGFADLNKEFKRRFGQSLSPGDKRDEWRKYLASRRSTHFDLTDKIIAHESRMNSIVYDAFGLDATERQLIEDATKYPYGAV